MTVFTILTLHVPHDRRDDVVNYYAAADVLRGSGAASAKLCIDPIDPGAVVVIAEWPDPSAYEAWQAAPERDEFSRRILAITGNDVTATTDALHLVAST
ncbi:MAG TPA: antibiotic biosynthesis monooxygenase [Nocardioides sp.]